MNHAAPYPIRLLPWGLLALCVFASVHFSRFGWTNPLVDSWRFRETQTALSTRAIVEDGFQLDYATPVLGAPWSIPFEFPTYEFCVAALVKLTGWPLESAGRLVSLGFAYGAFALLGVFVARGTRSTTAGIFSAAIALPAGRSGWLELRTEPGPGNAYDWSVWRDVRQQ